MQGIFAGCRARLMCLGAILIVTIFYGAGIAGAEEAAAPARPVPVAVNLDAIQLEIVDALFVAEYEGTDNRYEAGDPDEYRAVVMTLRVTKEAGKPLVLSAPDLALHYYHGSSNDVLPCNGLSGFSTERSTDRPMALLARGYGRSATGAATTKAKTVYVDVFFDYLEPDTRELYLLVGQPVGRGFHTQGWGTQPLDFKKSREDGPPAAIQALFTPPAR